MGRGRKMIAVASVLGALGGASWLYCRARVRRLPPNCPARFLSGGGRRASRVVVCAGDSLTHGNLGFDYVGALARRLGPEGFSFINAGVNGDLAYNLWKRMDSIVACHPDHIVVLIGINDVLALADAASMKRAGRMKGVPRPVDLEWFRDIMLNLVRESKMRTQASIALCSLPVLGDDPDDSNNDLVALFSESIRSIAADEGIGYLPLFERMSDSLRANPWSPPTAFRPGRLPLCRAVFQRFILGWSVDTISGNNRYRLTSDGIHLNSRGGWMMMELVENWLRHQG